MAGTVVICFTDIVGSTEVLARLGDDAFDDLRRRHFEVLERQVDANGGELVKRLGDGIMAAFGSASDAVSAGVAMQRAVHAEGHASAGDALALRVGIAAGDANQEDGDWYGTPVVEGSRLCAAAAPGQILVGEVVRLLAGSRGGHEFAPVGALELKGLPEPVAASEVQWAPTSSVVAVPLPGPLTPDAGELPFAGRDDVLESLQRDWKAVVAGERRAAMIAGEPGIGKTRLVTELARAVHADGATVLLGRADEHVDAPFGPWREALRWLVRHAPEELLTAHVADHGGELGRIVPELARRISDARPPVEIDPDTERLLLFEAVTGLLEVTGRASPVMLVLDDVHWADRSTLLLLLHVLRTDVAPRLLVIATYRDTDVDRSHPLAGVLADLRRLHGVERIPLVGLDADGVAELLVRAGGHDLDDEAQRFATTLLRETEGNPFFVGEVIRHLIESGGLVQVEGRWRAGATLEEAGLPEGVREVIGRRLEQLPEVANEVLGAASVLGREFDVGLLAEVSALPAEEVLAALEPAERARLIAQVPGAPGRYSFAHALVRTVLGEELSTNRRVRLHRATGVALEARPDPPLAELAYHFGEAAVMGETERAMRYAQAAAEEALELAAPEEAAALVRRALETADLGEADATARAGLQLLLARAIDATGMPEEARNVVADVFDRMIAAGELDRAREAALEYGGYSGVWDAYGDDRAATQLQAVLEALPAGDSEERAMVLARLAHWLLSAPGDKGAQAARETYDMAVRLGAPGARAEAAQVVAWATRNVDPAASLRYCDEVLSIETGGPTRTRLLALSGRADALLALGDLAGVDRTIDAARAETESIGLSKHNLDAPSWKMVRAQIAGRFDDALTVADQLDAFPGELVLPSVFAALGRSAVAFLRGVWDEAGSWAAEASRRGSAIMNPYLSWDAVTASPTDRRSSLDRWRRDVEPNAPAWARPPSVGALAELSRSLGEGGLAASFAEEFTDHSGLFFTNGVCWFNGPWDTALGVLWATAGELDRAVDHLRRAVEQCDSIGAVPFGVIARVELATAARVRGAAGDEELASEASAEARLVAEEVGMPGWLERLDRLDAGDPEPWREYGR